MARRPDRLPNHQDNAYRLGRSLTGVGTRRPPIKYLVLTIRKPTFDASFVDAHYAFLDDLRERGKLEQSGPFTDRSGGAYVLLADNIDEATQMAARDPLHIHDCSTVTVREWKAS